MRDNIAVINDINFFNLLEEYDGRFIYCSNDGDEENLIKEIERFSAGVVLIGENSSNLIEMAEKLYKMEIEVVVFGSGVNLLGIREMLRAGKIGNYFLKSEINQMIDYIKTVFEKVKYCDKIALKTEQNCEKIVKIDEIVSVQYDRIKRRTIFSAHGREYFLNRNLSEVEEYISNFKNFYRVDRSVIINGNAIDLISYSEECIIMQDGSKVFVSSSKIREVKLKMRDKIMFI